MTTGLKFDQGKLAYHLQDEDADAEMTAVLTFGAVKYEPGNWVHVEGATDRYYGALRRHLRASRRGEVLDPETGLLTLAAAACNIHFLLALELRKHPELVETFPERLKESLRRAGVLRKERLEAFEEAMAIEAGPDLAPLASLGWTWRVADHRGRSACFGKADTREAAKEAAEKAFARKRFRSGKIYLSEKLSNGFRAEGGSEITSEKKPSRKKRSRRR